MGDNFWNTALYTVGVPAWGILLVYLARTFKDYPNVMAQWNARQRDKGDEKARDWQRLRDEVTRLDGRVQSLEAEVDDCRKERAMWMARAIAAESAHLGEGEALQKAARIVAAERLEDKRKKES